MFECEKCGNDTFYMNDKQILKCDRCGQIAALPAFDMVFRIQDVKSQTAKFTGGAGMVVDCDQCGVHECTECNEPHPPCESCGQVYCSTCAGSMYPATGDLAWWCRYCLAPAHPLERVSGKSAYRSSAFLDFPVGA